MDQRGSTDITGEKLKACCGGGGGGMLLLRIFTYKSPHLIRISYVSK